MNIMTQPLIIASVLVVACMAQRPFYAKRPIGYPVVEEPSAQSNDLGNRFGTGDTSSTTQRLPIEALGDRELVDRLSKLPLDKQPFWFLNWRALEEHRKRGHTFQQNSNNFIRGLEMFNNAQG